MFEVDPLIKDNRALYWAAVIQVFYGVFELVDTFTIGLISIGLIPNLYTSFVSIDTEIGTFMETMPVIFIPIFAFFSILRLVSGYWILQNKAKGFWMALFVTGASIVAAWFFLPFSALDLVIICPFIILLFMGYYRDSPIIIGESLR